MKQFLCIVLVAVNLSLGCSVDTNVDRLPDRQEISEQTNTGTIPENTGGGETKTPEEKLEVIDDGKVSLEVAVSGFASLGGRICISVFNSSVGFPDDPTKVYKAFCEEVDITTESRTVVVEGLERETPYAVAVFRDENANQILDQVGELKIPIEDYGFSRNPSPRIGAPSFEEVEIQLLEKKTYIEVRLIELA